MALLVIMLEYSSLVVCVCVFVEFFFLRTVRCSVNWS